MFCTRWRELHSMRWLKHTRGSYVRSLFEPQRWCSISTNLLDHCLVQLSALTGFPTNGPDTIWGQTTQGLERRFVWKRNKRKLDVHKINSINPYAEEKITTSTLYKKLNSTAKIKSTSEINSSKIRQISSRGFQVTDERKTENIWLSTN